MRRARSGGGCTNLDACNYDELATDDDGSCVFPGDVCDDDDDFTINDTINDYCECLGEAVEGCTDSAACNYDELATEDDGTCVFPGDVCDDGDDFSINDTINEDCACLGEAMKAAPPRSAQLQSRGDN